MPRAQYFISCDGDAWSVLYEFKRYGPYGNGSRHEAFRAAVESAYEAGERGFDAEVLIADRDGAYQVAWQYGSDSFPPDTEADRRV
jgi:hypothetical protein